MQLVDIIDDASDAVRASVQAAYDAGRVAGREEAMAELQSRLSDFFDGAREPARVVSIDEAVKIMTDVPVTRAAPGSVKPTIEKMLKDAKSGLTAAEIADRTGFKFNSVRGTLWALGKEGFAENREGRWFVRPEIISGSPVKAEEPEMVS